MLICRACASRTANNLLRRIPAAENRNKTPSRAFATQSIRRPEPQDDWGELEAVADNAEKSAISRYGKQAVQAKSVQRLRRETEKELRLTKDPFHIADRVRQLLKDNNYEKAIVLTREASRNKQVVVSWNHLIEHQLGKRNLHDGIKLYNEMKKRAQLPNAQTFTIIFKGCAQSGHPKLAVGEALKIYNSMMASTRLRPNTIHLNAVLDVCARARDLESMFIILRTAGGIRAPNNLTYTIILNALRYQRSNEVNPNEDPRYENQAVTKSIETTIARAKMVWDEVINRWKKGEINMDEELMCAMGRVLLLGGARQTDSILGVVGEVLGITKLLDGQPGLDNKNNAKKSAKPEPAELPKKPQDPSALEDLAASGNWDKPEEADEYSSSQRRKTPEPEQQQQYEQQQQQQQQQQKEQKHSQQQQQRSQGIGPRRMAKMTGNNALSLIMRALAEDKRTKLAGRYWDYMTHSYGIVPDRRNYRDYIDCLSTGAASGRAARVLLSMPPAIDDGNLYRRGLLLCHFDALNENAFDNATTIYDAMIKKLRVPDPRCMNVYLQVAASNSRKFKDQKQYPSEQAGNLAYGRQIVTAFDRIWEPLRLATNSLAFSDATILSKSPREVRVRTHVEREDILEAAKNFVATTEKFLSQALIPKTESDHKVALIRKRVMNNFIQRWLSGRAAQARRKSDLEASDEAPRG